jgi:ABC-2 type transport system permease protein
MPIYDLGYRHWKGDSLSAGHRSWAIAKTGIVMFLRRRNFLVLLLLSFIPFIIRGVMLYAFFFSEQLNIRIPFFSLDSKFYFDFLSWQLFWIFAMSLYIGSGLIANDLRCNALQIYFSKPLRRVDYLLGKLGILFFFVLSVTLVPGLLLWLLHLMFAGTWEALQQNAWIGLSILVYSLILALINGLLMLAFSSLSKNSRFAGLVFFAVYFFSESVYGVLRVVSRDTSLAFCSLKNNYLRLGELLFDRPSLYNMPAWPSILILIVLAVGSLAILFWRIKPVEVVK